MNSDHRVVSRRPSALSRIWPASANWKPGRGAVRVFEDLSYLDAPGLPSQRIDLFLPALESGENKTSNTPWVLFIHGGVWRPQHRRLFRGWTGLYSNIGSFLARNGIAAAIAGYRQSQGVSALGAIDDLKAATHFVRAHAAEWEISAEQFFIAGHSGGGHLALTLANTERPNGVISLAGFYDCARFEATLEGKQRLGFKAVFDDVLGNTAIRSPGQGFVKRPLPLLLGIAEHDPASLHVEFEQLSRLCQDSKVPISTLDVKSCDHMGLVLEIGASNDVIGPVLVEFIRRFASNPERAAQAKP